MRALDRRTFLKTAAAAALAAPALAGAEGPAAPPWRKAYMLGGVAKGPILPHLELLKEAGFEGVELVSPNELERDEVLRARDQTGLVIHGVSGSRHWRDTLSDPDPAVVGELLDAKLAELAQS